MKRYTQDCLTGFYIVLFLLLPNLPFALASLHFELGRPWLNLDYLFAAVLYALNRRLIAFLFLILAIVADALTLLGQVYPFIRIHDLLYLSRYVFLSSEKNQLFIFISLLLVFFVFCGSVRVVKRVAVLNVLILFNLAIVPYLFNVYSKQDDRNRFWRVTDRPAVSSQLVNYYDYRGRAFIQTYHLEGDPFAQIGFRGATEQWAASPNKLADKLLLIVNESWGVSNNKNVQIAVVEPIIGSPDRFDVKTYHEMPFIGATVAGEMRELCGVRPNHFNLSTVIDGYENCLPKRFAELGYTTHALHGAVGLMYDRHLWYPRAGFQDITFFETKPWPNRCYSFPGACDVDLAQEVGQKLMADGKRFVYWLSLNTHNFYDLRDIHKDVFECSLFGIQEEDETCRSMKLQAQFFLVLSEMLSAPEFSGMEVIVVGDHAPPIFNAAEKEKYFKEGFVSLLNFTVK